MLGHLNVKFGVVVFFYLIGCKIGFCEENWFLWLVKDSEESVLFYCFVACIYFLLIIA